MKIKCNQKELLLAAEAVSRACVKGSKNEISEKILFAVVDGRLRLEATDINLTIQKTIDASIEGDMGQGFAIESAKLVDLLKTMPNTNIEIECVEGGIVLKNEKSVIKLPSIDGQGFPQAPIVENTVSFEVDAADLRSAITETIFAVSQDEIRPVLTGEMFSLKDGKLSIAACDGYRISVKTINANVSQGTEGNFIVAGRTVAELQKLVTEDPVKFSFGDKHVLCTVGEISVISRLLEGDFIQYEQLFNTEVKSRVKVPVKEFLNAAKRIKLIGASSKEKKGPAPAILAVGKNEATLTTKNEHASTNESVDSVLNGEEFRIAFNSRYLEDIFKTREEKEVEILYTGELTQMMVIGEDYKHLVLPIRIPAE